MKCSNWIFINFFILLFAITNGKLENFQECLQKDSISCLQMQFFREMKELLNQDVIHLLSGLSLVNDKNETRVGKNLDLKEMEGKIENATDVFGRQDAIEDFLIRRARDVVVEKTIRWDVGQTARNILNSIPETIKAKLTNYATEARGKGKKLLRVLLPLLIGLKLKMVGAAVITFIVIAVLAKKAIFASLVSLIISGIIGLKKLLAAKQPVYDNVSSYHPQPSWNQASPVYDHSNSDYGAQKLAYNSHIA